MEAQLEEKEVTRASYSVTINTNTLRELLEGTITHAHKGEDLPVLNSVLLAAPIVTQDLLPGRLIAAATDRYRLIEGSINLAAEGHLPATLIRVGDVKKILTMIKGDKSHQTTVSIYRAGDTVTVGHLGQGLVFQTFDGTFPPYAHLFPTQDQAIEPMGQITFNPALFADYAKIAGKKQGVKITFYGEKKPMGISFPGHTIVTWNAILMPMKIY